MHGGLDCGRGTEDDIVASMCQDMFTSCMGIIVLHWYHSPSMQLTTAMTALPPSPTARLVTYDAKCCGSSMCRAYGSPQIDQRLLKQPNKAGINRNGDNHHHRNCHVVTCDFFKRSTLNFPTYSKPRPNTPTQVAAFEPIYGLSHTPVHHPGLHTTDSH